MAMDVSRANAQAANLSSCSSELNRAMNLLNSYKSNILNNYQSSEVPSIVSEINSIIKLINGAMNELNSVGNAVRTSAKNIRNQELTRIRAAQNALNAAKASLDNLTKRRKRLNEQMRYITDQNELNKFRKQQLILNKQILDAQRKYNKCYSELQAARR